MRNLLRATLILALVAGFFTSKAWAQTYTLKKPAGDQLKKEIIALEKQLFKPEISLEYTISTYDLIGSFDEIPKSINYTLDFKKLQEDQLAKDPTNSLLWNNLGNYYNAVNNKEEAQKSFRKAYDNLETTFSKDSAVFHSYKGILKLNLGMEGAVNDLEEAFKINPNDSLAATFLPLMLLNTGEFDKAMNYCRSMVDESSGKNQGTWFMFYLMADYFKQFTALQSIENGIEQLRGKEYNQVLDLSRVNAIYEQYKTNQTMANAKLMSDILALYFKLVSFEAVDGQIQLNYTKKELKKILEIKNELIAMKGKVLMNEFSRVKNLGFISFIEGKSDEAIVYFKESIALFPEDKSNDQFTSVICYNSLFCIYSMENDLVKEKAVLAQMIELDEKRGPNVKRLCDMAKCYILEDDYANAYNWAYKAFQASETDFETFRVLAHYSFYQGDGHNLDAYIAEAGQKVTLEDQYHTLSLQIAMYYLTNEMVEEAYRFIKQARDIYPEDACELCDDIEKTYIKVTK
jgi:tetratricopeptide (TPR) repeat protein